MLESVQDQVSERNLESQGYVTDQFSKVSIQWLEWETKKQRKLGFPTFINMVTISESTVYQILNTMVSVKQQIRHTNFTVAFGMDVKIVTLKIVTRPKYPEPNNL
ncbi:LOW QUALITY PROTEIN: hypothetical protein KUTeg_014601 [Tegillarca granosa]|uniref:Uncharacterized protein n=1 Tax=Tegillarca granosa TaxID=220873 RepID=A0ABQ9ERI2_TEGGR|nr:LOW QUALITY PROTEIN: hypothetical protein KUTeg_014601 [Tegillarca granosa]